MTKTPEGKSRREFLKGCGLVAVGCFVFSLDSCISRSSPQPSTSAQMPPSASATLTISQPSNITPTTSFQSSPPPIPTLYQSLYAQLQQYLEADNQLINTQWDGSEYAVNYAAELLKADANAGPGILQSSTQQVMNEELDSEKSLGLKAITVQIGFPIFEPGFYIASGQSTVEAQNSVQNWLNYYQSIAQAIHSRGLKMIVESNPLLSSFISSQSSFNPGSYFQSIDFNTYKAKRSQHNIIVAQQIKPDYLLLQTEPDTDATNDFRSELNDPSQDVPMISQFVLDLENAGIPSLHSSIQLGAGAGAWQPEWQQYISGFAAIAGLDKLDTHIYNLPPNINQIGEVQVAMKVADMAHAVGKGASISEFWAHKSTTVNPYTGTGDPIIDVRARDLFSFWAPLDNQFLTVMAKLANFKRFDYVSAFGWYTWFNLIDYNSLTTPPVYPATSTSQNSTVDAGIMTMQDQMASQALAEHQVSLTGKAYQSAISATPALLLAPI
ncbi:MAG: hypothetical protein ABSD79_03850 [Dehalococcoidales bacterium]